MRNKFLFAAAILSAAIATPTMAQQAAITWNAATTTTPEYCIQNYANDVCDREGYSHFYTGVGVTGAMAYAPPPGSQSRNSYVMADKSTSCSQRYRSFDPVSGTYLGRDQLRHPCQ
jgi:hypothetical protein